MFPGNTIHKRQLAVSSEYCLLGEKQDVPSNGGWHLIIDRIKPESWGVISSSKAKGGI